MSSPTAIIVGAGVAGAATAVALSKAGIRATVYEARPEGADTNGVMLTLATNGLDALRALDADGAVRRLGFATPSILLRNHAGKRLGIRVTGGVLADGTTSRTMRRADLAAALQGEALARGVRIERGRRLTAVREGRDAVAATFADGSEVEADFLVGADGVYSGVRPQIDPHAPDPVYSGLVTTGGYVRGVEVPSDPGGYEMIFGRRAFFGYAEAPDGEVWWFVNLPYRPEPAGGEVQALPTAHWRRRCDQAFADDAGPALDLVAATPDFAPMTPIHSMPTVPRWHSDRVVLVGDAAHAPSPTSGQGASLAVEDAVVLALSLRDADSPAAAFARFEAARRGRVEKIVRAAARINNSKAPGVLGRAVRDAVLPVVLRLTANSKADREVYEHHLDWPETSGMNPAGPR